SKQFCNLTEVVARPDDTEETLMDKVRVATILGTYQSMLTYFPYLSNEWKENCEEERLLGVSITGIMDSPILKNPEVLRKLKDHAIEVNRYYAKKFDINPSTCITCVKPSGSLSKLVNSSSGIHTRWSEYYRQNIRISANDSLFHMLKDQKYPYSPEVNQEFGTASTYVLPFPIESPKHSLLRKDLSAIDQLEIWKRFKTNYTEHNPSVTIYIGNDEWIDTGQWVYKNWDIIGGLAFLPRDDNVYPLAPWEEINKEEYNKMVSTLPKIDFSQIMCYERDDQTSGSREYACIGDKCETL
ncbi:ribonucleoside-triphosphate reductase, partial [Candidatus Pacearchaeota archaeon]|nr:ribonucleoside-triphosphate reductase [Candidatus Pacearchaeota archaeon]